MFAVVDGVLFKPLPYPASHRLFSLSGSAGPPEGTASLSALDVTYLSKVDPRISVTGITRADSVTHPDRPDLTISSVAIDPAFFDVLGHYPLIGGFTRDHYSAAMVPGAPRPVIVTHAFWRQWLGSDPAAIGRPLEMVSSRLLIVGVLPHDFVFPTSNGWSRPDVLVPLVLSQEATTNRWQRGMTAVARLREAITVEQAQVRLDAALASRADEYPPPPQRTRPGPFVAVAMQPLDSLLAQNERPLFSAAFAGAALLILLGAINVAGLFGARARDRGRELSIRAALGAGRRHLTAVLLAEAAVIALGGGVLGVLVARPVLRATNALLPETLLLLKAPAIDWRVMVFAVFAAIVPVVLFALAATAVIRDAPARRLAGGETSTPRARSWPRDALLAAESAIGITLVVTGSLMLASFIVLRAEDAGFDREGLAVIELRMAGATTPEERQAREARAFDRMQRVPGIRTVATVGVPLLEQLFSGSQFKAPPGAERFFASDTPVSAAFVEVAGLRVLDGRVPTPQEIEAARPFVVVSEGTASAYWPAGRAVGQMLESERTAVTVIGVVEDARFGGHDDAPGGEIYGENVDSIGVVRSACKLSLPTPV